ncbi:hypothetical protein PCASD_02964 [Puccinia coronata f. sp. avenae]|uniref:Uncharacterized protein n=1 Tax=Puccinia coronata f. sp. avenae TaxID=200324 RepID=A0A2N5VGQ8_9BASI|nr:hypothetical protein PCASD_02964 [Puccinia coronata f. sp. avenae]
MSTSQTPNHPVLVPAFLEAHGDTALQCAGISDTALLNLPLTLLTNTALSNTILSGLFFFLSGRLLAPNDGTSPVLNYAQEALLNIPLTLGALIDASNKTFIVGLGQVVERCKVVSDNTTQTTQEVQIVRNLVDWDTEVNMAVILTLRERPQDATLVKRPLDDGKQTVQWLLLTQEPVGRFMEASNGRFTKVAPTGRFLEASSGRSVLQATVGRFYKSVQRSQLG